MNKIFKRYKIPILFTIVCLALITLSVFQVAWINASRNQIEQQFDQKVTLAIGNALTDFNTNHQTHLDVNDQQECGPDGEIMFFPLQREFMSKENQRELKESLNAYMMRYGIDEKYRVDIFDTGCKINTSAYCCAISTKKSCGTDYNLGVSFLDKNDYLFDQMKFMIISSILIFLLLATVSFMILRALIKQKRITANNIDFFNNTAHELKTPLTNISLAMKLLGRKHEDINGSKYTHIIKGETAKLADQIERVLFLSKMENGDHLLKKEAINIKSVLEEVVENMQMRLEEKQGVIQLNFPVNDVVVLGDYYHLSNVFKNLIDNAIKYCDTQPRISIVVEDNPSQVNVRFTDNGIGISKSDQEHIFEKFQRVNTGDVREAKGFGIGLSYVKTVIEMHKGLINVSSELNKGSQFELVLPNV